MSGGDNLSDRPVISDETVMLGRYPVRVAVQRVSWSSAVAASPLYLAMGRDDRAWAFTSKAAVERLIATLQAAVALARDPWEADVEGAHEDSSHPHPRN